LFAYEYGHEDLLGKTFIVIRPVCPAAAAVIKQAFARLKLKLPILAIADGNDRYATAVK
jgi:hypothetical protein